MNFLVTKSTFEHMIIFGSFDVASVNLDLILVWLILSQTNGLERFFFFFRLNGFCVLSVGDSFGFE